MKHLFVYLFCLLFSINMDAQDKKVLVAYFSCTGNTEKMAKAIAQFVKADLYQIVPQQAYTDADLNWRDTKSRSSVEMNDPNSRPQLADKNAGIEGYNVIFIGYPIWWDTCPTIINTFMESYNFSGKTVIPFATSGSSTISNSEKSLKSLYKGIDWKPGKRLNGNTAEAQKWAQEAF